MQTTATMTRSTNIHGDSLLVMITSPPWQVRVFRVSVILRPLVGMIAPPSVQQS
jgi:hypothetical protein